VPPASAFGGPSDPFAPPGGGAFPPPSGGAFPPPNGGAFPPPGAGAFPGPADPFAPPPGGIPQQPAPTLEGNETLPPPNAADPFGLASPPPAAPTQPPLPQTVDAPSGGESHARSTDDPGASASGKKSGAGRKRYAGKPEAKRSPLKIVLIVVFALGAVALGIALGTGLGASSPPAPPPPPGAPPAPGVPKDGTKPK
jgi:hypothetical protein